ncbi:MAG: hypothetical protein QNJ97_14845 [Myxococcota bacterium]|nr:hypothetical protein [Myxococcota bacterium]
MAKKKQERWSEAHLEDLIEEATVDAYEEFEQTTGLFTMIEEHLELPFTSQILGIEVTVVKVDINDRYDIVAICERGKDRQTLPVLDLPLPELPPRGWEWIEAYRHWARRWR